MKIEFKDRELLFLERDSEEWTFAWAELAKQYDLELTNQGEAWQYMGTVLYLAGRAVHQFRHRAYEPEYLFGTPHGFKRCDVNIEASGTYQRAVALR